MRLRVKARLAVAGVERIHVAIGGGGLRRRYLFGRKSVAVRGVSHDDAVGD